MKKNNKVLIEIAAQHPLINGKPGKEFEHRLKKAINLYHKEKEKGNVPILYVPGSLHSIKKNGIWESDKISLSESGKLYLLENGILEKDIRSSTTNDRLKKDGIYNSGEECLVATLIAKEENIERIISVASPIQIPRKALFYLEYGYLPEIYGVGLEKTYHNYIQEIFGSLYITYFIDYTLHDLFFSIQSRIQRDKNYKITAKTQELINNKILIPDNINIKKDEMLKLYKTAQKNMQKFINNKKILIGLFLDQNHDEENLKEKFDYILQLYNQHNNKQDITIAIYGQNLINVEQLLKKINVENLNIVKLDSYKEILEYFTFNKMSTFYYITDSPKVINEALFAIKFGILPIIFSVPNLNISYKEQIDNLYLTLKIHN